MHLINIIGHSNSGKTTLIVNLIPALAKIGRVASVKQLGCNMFSLPEGKDTTRHFTAGAECSTGIDSEKSVMSIHGGSLEDTLAYYYWIGIDYVVIEGFKELHLPCAVIGDYTSEFAVLHNPGVEDICSNVSLFAEYIPRS